MKNKEVAKLLYEFAKYTFDEPFKEKAFRKAGLTIDPLGEDIEEVWKRGKLQDIPGVGEGISKKIDDFLKNGKSKYLEDMKKKIPIDIDHLNKVAGIGPKTIQKLYKELKIKSVGDLKKAAEGHKIRKIKGFGEITERNILKNIESNLGTRRFPLKVAMKDAELLLKRLESVKEVIRASLAGSLRRKKESIGDIDILASSKNPGKVMDAFKAFPNVQRVIAKGDNKASVVLNSAIQADLRVVDEKVFGAALLYFTGSQAHNIALRRLAIDKDWKLSEYGLFERKSGKLIAAKTEEEIYKKLGLSYIDPHEREDMGEIEKARAGQ
jgi:DNA polymerase (family X)